MSFVRVAITILRIRDIIMHVLFYLHFDWLLTYGQLVIALNSDVTPADNSFLHNRYNMSGRSVWDLQGKLKASRCESHTDRTRMLYLS